MRPIRILIITALTTAVLYAPQPLLPLFSKLFAVRGSSAALLITLAFAPLALAPLCYGYVLESLSPVRILRMSVLTLALSEIVFAFSWTYPVLLVIRIIQGLTIPAILTSLMTYISIETPAHKLQRMLSFYIAATITGGFMGRLSSGVLTAFLGWRPFFCFLGVALLVCYLWVPVNEVRRPPLPNLLKRHGLWLVLLERRFRRAFIVTSCAFFVLASVMNFVPFRLVQIAPNSPEFLFGLLYTGYLAGVFSSLMAGRIKEWYGSEENAIIAGLVGLGASLILLLVPIVTVVMLSLFLVSAAMFLVHTLAAKRVNRLALSNKGIVNGLYVSSYYAGGMIVSYLPGLVYERYGWSFFIATLGVVIVFGAFNALLMKRTEVE